MAMVSNSVIYDAGERQYELVKDWGELPQGTWTLRVVDLRAGVTGTWSNFSAEVRMGKLVGRAFYVDKAFIGVELDLDSIRSTLSSAFSPVGITAIHARQYISFAANNPNLAYLHICEGAVKLDSGKEDDQTGKLISYLVTDFIKGN